MKFENEFDVRAPADEVYAALLDVERVAPCMPGAEVIEKTGDDAWKVGVKVKLGPISMHYRGDAEVVDKQPEERRASMKVRAKEARGQGTVDATIGMAVSEEGEATRTRLDTDVQMKGKAASMGQGVIQDVAATLIATFADNLAKMLAGPAAAPAAPAGISPEPAAAPAAPAGISPEPAAAPATPAGAAAEPGVPAEAAASAEPGAPAASAGEAPPHAAAGSVPPRAPGAAAPAPEAALPVGAIAANVAKGRLRDPRFLAAAVIGVLLLVLLLRKRR